MVSPLRPMYLLESYMEPSGWFQLKRWNACRTYRANGRAKQKIPETTCYRIEADTAGPQQRCDWLLRVGPEAEVDSLSSLS